MLEALRQALMHGEITLLIGMTRRPRVPDSLHSGPDDGLNKTQARCIGSRKPCFPAPDNKHERGPRVDIEKKVHFVRKVSSFAVLTVIFARMKSVRRLVPASTDCRFLFADCELIQWIEQVRSGQVTIQVMTSTARAHRMVYNVWLRIAVKREQTRRIVVNRRADHLGECVRNLLVVTDLDEPC